MYAELYQAIEDRLTGLGLANVSPALGGDPPLPACQPYFIGDKAAQVNTTKFRELIFGVKVTVGHFEQPGAAQNEAMTLLDTIRAGCDKWQPENIHGLQGPVRVRDIRIEDFRDHGSTVYLVLLAVRVIPAVFQKTLRS